MLALLFALWAAPEIHLLPGKFGNALDASRTPLAFESDARYRQPPITVECWAKLASKRGFNILVSHDDKSSADHWELYTYAGSGRLAVYLPGYSPAEIISKKPVCDNIWHHCAFTFDGKTVALYVDGKLVHTQSVARQKGGKTVPGPLGVGLAVDGSQRIGCDGLIDDLRISRVIRKIVLPEKPAQLDADTLGIWSFDDGAKILADPAWTPPPNSTGEKWQRMTDVDWVDGRLRQMDTGPTFNATFAYPLGQEKRLVYKGTAIKLGSGGMLFDRATLRLAAVWTEGWLQHSDRRFGLLNTPSPAGPLLFAGSHTATTLPLDGEQGRFEGLHLHGDQVVLHYTWQNVNVRELPILQKHGDTLVFVRIFEVGRSDNPVSLPLAPAATNLTLFNGVPATLETRDGERWLVFPPSKTSRTEAVVYWPQTAKPERDRKPPLPSMPPSKKAGPERWKQVLTTRGQVAADTAPYVVDTITIPYENPYKALFFCTGLDFLPDGSIAVCTCHGDVWKVSFSSDLASVRWKRYATGLYQPLGLKVIDGKIFVLERGQLTRLHGENEAYFYENVCNAWHTGAGEHSYDTCLETDSKGNFYFFKTGDTHLPHGGCLLRVSSDGRNVERLATGFRHPIGLSVGPDDTLTGADQEGNWMPATRLDIYRPGGFYGDMRAHHRASPPESYDLPLLWMPKDVDNSAGGQVWIPHDRFGLPRGQLLHLSYGQCKLYAVHRQVVQGTSQGAVVDLGVLFLSGSARGRFHPNDGHLYVCGLNGWQTAAQADGCLQRVRYTGKELAVVTHQEVFSDAIHLRFARKLDAQAMTKGWRVEQWNYRYSGDYGSKRWSVRQPHREGLDRLEVAAVQLDADGKGVLLQIKDLRPAMQTRIEHLPSKTLVHSTLHKLAKR
jgi:hypothetical protein